jgi:hypothetical protein
MFPHLIVRESEMSAKGSNRIFTFDFVPEALLNVIEEVPQSIVNPAHGMGDICRRRAVSLGQAIEDGPDFGLGVETILHKRIEAVRRVPEDRQVARPAGRQVELRAHQ